MQLVNNTRYMKKITFAALATLTITACSTGPKFQVNGDVSGAGRQNAYLEASGLEGIVPLDSVKLKGEGTFSLNKLVPSSRILPSADRRQSNQLFCRLYRNGSDQSSVYGLLHRLYRRRFGKQQQDKRN